MKELFTIRGTGAMSKPFTELGCEMYVRKQHEYLLVIRKNDNLKVILQEFGNFVRRNEEDEASRKVDSEEVNYWYMKEVRNHVYALRTKVNIQLDKVVEDFEDFVVDCEKDRKIDDDCYEPINENEELFSEICMDDEDEADGVVSSASGEEEEEVKLELLDEEESTEKDPAAPIEIKFMEVEEEESDDSSSTESVGVVPNLSDDGEMSAPIIIEDVEEMSALASSRDNREMSAPIVSRDIREMSAPVASRDSREMSAPTISRDTEEMSALGISEAMWTAALRVRFTSSLKTRKRIIAKALMPQQVLPIVGTLEWRRLDFIVYRERMNARHLMRSSQNALIREEARKEFLRMEEFYKATGCGSYKNARNVRRLRSELL